MTESENGMDRLLAVREHLAQPPAVGSVMLNRSYVDREKAPEGLPHPEFKSMTMGSAELVVTHVNGIDKVTYEVDSQGNVTGAKVGKVEQRKTARERLADMPSPTNAMEALVLLLTTDEVALGEGSATPEDVRRTWKGFGKDLQKVSLK